MRLQVRQLNSFVSGAAAKKLSLWRLGDFTVLLRFLLMISAILFLSGFKEMQSVERRVLARLVASDVLIRAASFAKVVTSGVSSVPTFAVLLVLLDTSGGFPRVSGEKRARTFKCFPRTGLTGAGVSTGRH